LDDENSTQKKEKDLSYMAVKVEREFLNVTKSVTDRCYDMLQEESGVPLGML
jgi:hypothetical protein